MQGDRLRNVQKKLLDLFAVATDLPIVWYEYQDSTWNSFFPKRGEAKFTSHCKLLHSFLGGQELCHEDMCHRSYVVLETGKTQLSQCHAGLYNLAVLVRE